MHTTTGLFDVQINGFAGVDFNSADTLNADGLDHALEVMLSCGVTACLPTLITASLATLEQRFETLDKAVRESRLGQFMIPGYHLEGPFLNPTDGYSGCHPAGDMRAPEAEQVLALERNLSRPILMITYAPEFDEGEQFAATLSNAGKILAMGHSAADTPTVNRDAGAGLKMSTHLGNGLPQVLHKLDNPMFAQLACDALSAGFIADGIHIPPHALKTLLRAKGVERSILVTDAVSAAAVSEPGIYPFAGMNVERAEDGSVRVPGSNYLAGSSLTLDAAIRNVVQWGFASFDEAVKMASFNPRNLLAPAFRQYGITLPASEVVWSTEGTVVSCNVADIRKEYK